MQDLSKYMLDNDVGQLDFLKYFRLNPVLTYRWDQVLLSSYLFIYRENNSRKADIFYFDYRGVKTPNKRARRPEELIGKDKLFAGKINLVDISNEFDMITMHDDWGFDLINSRLLEFCKKKQADAIYLSKKSKDDYSIVIPVVLEIADNYFRLGEALKNKYDDINVVENPDLN